MIPALAFNDANTTDTDDVNLVRDHYAAVAPKVLEFNRLGNGSSFKAKTTTFLASGLTIAATSKSRIYFEREDLQGVGLNIPINGYSQIESEAEKFQIYAGNEAFLSTEGNYKTSASGSSVFFRLDNRKLVRICASMLGGNPHAPILNNARILQLNHKKVSFFKLFRLLLNQIDIVGSNPKLLEKLAFDDRVYRLSAGLICQSLLLQEEPIRGRRPQVSSELEMLCEYLRANVKEPISLTQMEQMSGLSARKLQYAFRKEFGIGARGWLRKQRLHEARTALLDTHEPTTVEFVAYEFCFVSSSEFSWHYQQEFGELPEQTLSRGRS